VSDLVDEIEDIISWEDAGFKTDWSCYGFEYMRLVKAWREAEKIVRRDQNFNIQCLIRSYLKKV
jgi:hypothetical protein